MELVITKNTMIKENAIGIISNQKALRSETGNRDLTCFEKMKYKLAERERSKISMEG